MLLGHRARPRFLALHGLFAVILWLFVFLHIMAVHSKKSLLVPFSSWEASFKVAFLQPVAYLKDFYSAALLIIFYIHYICLNFNFFEEFLNNCEVTLTQTPFEMSPEWYFLPSFSVLKYFESKELGVVFSILTIFLVFLSLFFNKRVNNAF